MQFIANLAFSLATEPLSVPFERTFELIVVEMSGEIGQDGKFLRVCPPPHLDAHLIRPIDLNMFTEIQIYTYYGIFSDKLIIYTQS